MENLNILFTSVGRRSYLVQYFKEALGEKGQVHVANSSDMSPAFLVADHHIVTPLIYDENYIPFLLQYCKENGIKAIISLFDIDLPILSANNEMFQKIGTQVIVSDMEVMDICNDKWNTYKFLEKCEINTPKTYLTLDDAKEDIKSGSLNFPLFIKPRWGMGSLCVYEAENMQELDVLYLKAQRNIKNNYLKYESARDFSRDVLIQEKLFGMEYGLDIINDLEKNYQTTICKLKYAMRSGETDCALTIEHAGLKKIGECIAKNLEHIGNLDCDVFIDNDRISVLEMNARFGGGYPFSHLAGVNLPKAIIGWLLGEQIDSDVLKEDIGVMGQKDINIVKLERKMI